MSPVKLLLVTSVLIFDCRGFDPPGPSYGFSKCNPSWDRSRMDCDCDEGQVPCNVQGYPGEESYFGCISLRNKNRCCPRRFIYSSTPFYSQKYPAITCVKESEIFSGSKSDKSSKGCENPDEVSCRSRVKDAQTFVYSYTHNCQHIMHKCNNYCYQGYKWCPMKQVCLALSSYKSFCGKEKSPNDVKTTIADESSHVSTTTYTSTFENTSLLHLLFNDSKSKMLLRNEKIESEDVKFSLIGGVTGGVLAVSGLLVAFMAVIYNKNKPKQSQDQQQIDVNPDYGYAEDEDDIEFMDNNDVYFAPDSLGDIEMIDYNPNYGRASVSDSEKSSLEDFVEEV